MTFKQLGHGIDQNGGTPGGTCPQNTANSVELSIIVYIYKATDAQ